tara:strand:- start:411 stop:680 length:270 start_codon:yes stop_codon:yes gene_type:complete
MKNREIANRIAELHYPNEPNVIHDQKYRLVRMKTLADQAESELNLLTIPVVVGQSEQLINFLITIREQATSSKVFEEAGDLLKQIEKIK